MKTLPSLTLLMALLASPAARADDPAADVANAAPAPRSLRVTPDQRERFAAGLATKMDIDLEAAPLYGVFDYVAKLGNLPIVGDWIALEEEGIPRDIPVTLRAKGLPIGTTLDRVLEPLGLTWFEQNGVLRITSEVVAEELHNLELVVYDISELRRLQPDSLATRVLDAERSYPPIQFFGNLGAGVPGCGGLYHVVRFPEEDWLSDLVIRLTGPPESWEDQGGPGSIAELDGRLTVRQIFYMQSHIDRLLPALQRMGTAEPVQPTAWPQLSEKERAIRRALEAPATLKFEREPLESVVEKLQQRTGVDFLIDVAALEEEGIPLDEPITLDVPNVSLRSALRHLLEPLGLTWRIDNDALYVTSDYEATTDYGSLTLALFDARDLAASVGEDALLDMIIRTTGAPESWEDQGGPGTIVPALGGILVVRQTPANLLDIELLLADLRRVAPSAERDTRPKPGDVRLLDYTLLEHEPEQIADLIRTTIDSESWQGENAGTIKIAGRQLYVETTLANHERIHELLWTLKPVRDPAPAATNPAAPTPTGLRRRPRSSGGGVFTVPQR